MGPTKSRVSGRPQGDEQLVRGRRGVDGKDLIKISKSDIAGHRGGHAHRCAGTCAKRIDFAFRPRSDRISAHRHACLRSLCVVPH